MKRLLLALSGAVLVAFAAPLGALAGAREVPPAPSVELIKVQGVVDPASAGYVRGAIGEAEGLGATVVLQIDSAAAYGAQGQMLGRIIRMATVPVVAWIGPSGSHAQGGALFVVYSCGLVAMSPGSGIGPGRPFDPGTVASGERPAQVARATAALVALAPGGQVRPAGVRRAALGPAMPAGPARQVGAITLIASNLQGLLRALNGRTVATGNGPRTLVTEGPRGNAVAIRFHEIGPVRRVLHAVSTPTAVYVLLVLGLWGIAFELTQRGFGVAGIAGLLALALAAYGLTVVPFRWYGLALILLGTALQGLDVVIRRVAALTVVGTLAFAAGSFLAWHGVAPAIDLPLWLIVMASLGGFLYFGFVLTVALRSRERIREAQVGLVGLVGEARSDLNPEGGVLVKGTLWRARSLNGPIPKGTRVRVRSIEGLILRVEQDPG